MEKSNKTEQAMPEADCTKWLEDFVKTHGPVNPKEAYAAGAKVGFTRKGIKAARRYFGTLIGTRQNEDGSASWTWES